MFVLSLLACQEPFGADRHDLVGDRIAAVSAPVADGVVRPTAAIVAGGRLWSAEPVRLAWSWVADAEAAAEPPDAPIAEGPAPEIPVADGLLALHATFADGAVERAVIAPAEALVAIDTIDLLDVDRAVSDVTAEDLALDERLGWEATAADTIPEGGFARLEAEITGAQAHARWMATAGTFFELDPTRADWAAGELQLDDDELIPGDALPGGPVTVLALALGGANAFRAREILVGEPPVGVWTVSGRWLASDRAVTGLARATLIAADSPTGLALEGAVPVEAADLDALDPYGTEALPCAAPVSGPFDPSWLLDQRCARDAIVGAAVVLELR